MTNYRSGPFSDASLEIEFHGNGSLKKLDLSADNKPSQVIEDGDGSPEFAGRDKTKRIGPTQAT